ncbi:MAG: fasciclin domain-containing protein [Patescibacteria group bacterium]|nr:fasciclin domain-containing protein [Patescibacteria group bacterium]
MKILLDNLSQLPHVKIFLQALLATGLVSQLKNRKDWTVLLPTDQAWRKLGGKNYRELLRDKRRLVIILAYHLVPGKVYLSDLLHRRYLKTALGAPITVNTSEDVEINLDEAALTKADISCSDGVIHQIDSVLIPKVNARILQLLAQNTSQA